MMKLRQMAVCIIEDNKNNIYLLKKYNDSSFLNGKVVPIGGHMKHSEISFPEKAVKREITEETNILIKTLFNLNLKYIMLRNKNDKEIRIQYVYWAHIDESTNINIKQEGTLIKTTLREALKLNITETTKEIIKHRINNSGIEDVLVGTMYSTETHEASISWGRMSDWIEN